MTPSLTVGVATDAASAGRERLGQADKLALGSVARHSRGAITGRRVLRRDYALIRRPCAG
jgi:hypothetical protein